MELAELIHLSILLERMFRQQGGKGARPRADVDRHRKSHFRNERGCSGNCP